MLTINLIRENSDFVIKRLKVKQFDAAKIVSQIVLLDNKKRELQNKVNSKQNELNLLSKNIGILFKEGKIDEANKAKNKSSDFKKSVAG